MCGLFHSDTTVTRVKIQQGVLAIQWLERDIVDTAGQIMGISHVVNGERRNKGRVAIQDAQVRFNVQDLVLGDPGVPEAFVPLVVFRSAFQVLGIGVGGKFNHFLVAALGHWRQDGEDVGCGDPCRGNVGGKEDAFAKGSVGVDVEDLFVLCVGASG